MSSETRSPEEVKRANPASVNSRSRRSGILAIVLFVCGCCLALLMQNPMWLVGAAFVGVLCFFLSAWTGSFDPTINKNDLVIIVPGPKAKLSPALQKLRDDVQAKGKYPFEAYLAVIHSLKSSKPTQHVSAAELLKRFVHYVAAEYETETATTLKQWKISSPADLGEIIQHMVDFGVILVGPTDQTTDFLEFKSVEVFIPSASSTDV
jgi:uncharacterized repeat protein (TIGR04138 family)